MPAKGGGNDGKYEPNHVSWSEVPSRSNDVYVRGNLGRATNAPQRPPVPNVTTLVVGCKRARELYGDRFRQATNVHDNLAFVMKMIATAAKLEDGSPDQYATLTIARDIAAGAGEVPAAIQATE